MPRLVWDKAGTRTFESGLDRGVLYRPSDGVAVPWNGLTSVVEHFSGETKSIYYDGRKINELASLGDFSATLTAITYPDEFAQIEGGIELRPGVGVNDQPPEYFGLSYRTKIGNDVAGEDLAYKIHVAYNLMAVPSDKTYASLGSDPTIVEFQWEIYGVPEDLIGISGFRPTAHFVFDTRKVDPWLIEDIEKLLYGTTEHFAALPPMQELASFVDTWYRVEVIDNGDGTWTAIDNDNRPGFITMISDTEFEIKKIKASYLDEETYELSSTEHINDAPQISIEDRGDGTWIATTDEDGIIVMIDDDEFEIRDAEAVLDGPNVYHISDKLYTI